jgi:hypothetical protein
MRSQISRRQPTEAALLPALPLLIIESRNELDRIRDALNQEIKPRGIIEQMYVAEIAYFIWEILRLRRCKVAIVNSEFRTALENLLARILRGPGADPIRADDEAEDLAQTWFTDPDAKKRVAGLLKESQLDESAIEAEAMIRSAADLEALDRMLASLESRRNKALRCIAEYRGELARQLQESSGIIEGKFLALENGSSNKRSAAA